MRYSFIIPVKEINDYIRETISEILKIKRDDYEVIIYPDIASAETWSKTKQIATGHMGPAAKRSLATRDAKGEILVFIDDDSYPARNFLEKLDKDFESDEVICVGGPAITPENDSFKQKVSGAVFLSSVSGGFPERYIPLRGKRLVSDWPSVNLSVRCKSFDAAGGFNSDYWPGEDTKFCLDIINKLNGKILYDPELIVWHHRREGLFRHLKQIAGYGLHRGFFAKAYPETSFKFKYFIPSFFFLFVVLGFFASVFFPALRGLYAIGWFFYFLVLIKSFWDISRYEKNILIVLSSIYFIFFTHLVYGARFIQGFVFTKELRSKLR